MEFSKQEYCSVLPFPGNSKTFLFQGSSCPSDGTHVSCISGIGRQILYNCATWEACPWFQTILQSYSHQNRMALAQNRHIKQWFRMESSEVNSYSYGQFICDKKRQETRMYSRHAGQQKRHKHKEHFWTHWEKVQCSCLENPRDGGAWWAAVYGVTQSRTRLKRRSSSSSSSSVYISWSPNSFYLTLPPW